MPSLSSPTETPPPSDSTLASAPPPAAAMVDTPPARPSRLHTLLARPFTIHSFALTMMLTFACLYVVFIMKTVLLPLVMALLLSYLLAPIVRFLKKLRIPTLAGAGIVMATLILVLAYGVVLLSAPAMEWMEKAPSSLKQVGQTLSQLKKPMRKVTDATAAFQKMTADATSAEKKAQLVKVEDTSVPGGTILTQTPEVIAEIVTTVILLYFLLAYDGMFLGKLIKVIPRLTDKKTAVIITREIEQCISTYLLTITLINLGLGLAVGTAVGLLGMPNPVFWGALVAVFNFIPYLGSLTGMISLGLAAMLTFPHNLGLALAMPGAYLACATIEGNFITPTILGHSLTLNPIVILLALMFWGWMWGLPGAVIAVPVLAGFKILCDHIDSLSSIGEFLST